MKKIKLEYKKIIDNIKSKVQNSNSRFVILIKEGRKKQILNFSICLIITFLIILLSFISFFSSLVYNQDFTISPYAFVTSMEINDLDFGILPIAYISYYVCKIYFNIYIIVIGVMFAFLCYFLISKAKNISSKTNKVILVLLAVNLITVLLAYNYINIYSEMNYELETNIKGFFIFNVLLFTIKCILSTFLDTEFLKKEVKESFANIAHSFTIFFLVIVIYFTPLYIFPGTQYRVNGSQLLNGDFGILDLKMVVTYQNLLNRLILYCYISFIISIILFTLFKKLFVYYKPYHIFVCFITLLTYALMGLSYYVLYIDAKGYNVYLSIVMNTYSYIPFVLYISYAVGSFITKFALTNIVVLYQVDGVKGKNNQLTPQITDGNLEVVDPIPAFSELDLQSEKFKEDLNLKMKNEFVGVTLPLLVNHIITYARYSKEKLSYGKTEIKIFLSGLAASRLSILQGMSGTGKTSLPKIFMEAIDGICDLVAVESSWRDKNELLGYYNEFNKKYTPKAFTQFLYKAVMNEETPYFIVLDEMNLSRIEYYFADFLSLMEASEDKRFIKLFDVQLYPYIDERENYLKLLDGHTIKIPKNLWFIGTANRDESTFEISDKVYDRAQTLNFDKRAPKVVNASDIDYPKKFVSYQKLDELFKEAKSNLIIDLDKFDVIKKVEELLKPYKISFGNRILKQMEEFVKVYVGCSEVSSDTDKEMYIHEALDAILLSKVVRKLELKQIIDLDILIDEFKNLNLNRCYEFLNMLVDLT